MKHEWIDVRGVFPTYCLVDGSKSYAVSLRPTAAYPKVPMDITLEQAYELMLTQ